ncbi:FecR family protein [Oxalobacteraceae bacterium A2-2]
MTARDKEALKWALLQAERPLTPGEQAAFDDWHGSDIHHQGAFLRAQAIHNAMTRVTVQENLRPGADALAPSHEADSRWGASRWSARHGIQQRFAIALGGLAAAVAVGVLGGRHWTPPQEPPLVLATAKGEFRKVPLADHSVASINSGSAIEVRLSPGQRDINLRQGEAWFEVAKDKSRPFIVDAGGIRARAVGTAFGVRREANGAEVLVSEGVVTVSSDAMRGPPVRLVAGERAFIATGAAQATVERSPGEVARRLAWREGKIIFSHHRLKDAVADFNRYSVKPIAIADRSIEDKTLVGQYQVDAPERFARDVGAFLKVPVSITAQEIRIGK